MNLTAENIKTVTADAYKRMVISAAATIENNCTKLNDLNVFPVPDGDTGSNMAMTTKAAVSELMRKAPSTVGEAADIAAKSMLRGARGNSGVITSLLFRGIASEMNGMGECDSKTLANALQAGVAAAYKAVANPAEGTILTVSRLAADAAVKAADADESPVEVFNTAIASAKVALEQTMEMNPTLKKARVVDAGGYGWVLILEAMRDSLLGIDVTPAGTGVTESSADFSDFNDEDITFTYCTEFIVSKENDNNPAELKAELEKLGDSLVFVEDDEIIKVHVHTDDPGTALHLAVAYGQFVTVKVENMRIQHTSKVEEGATVSTSPSEPEQRYGMIAVAPGDGIAEVFTDLGVDAIVSGGQTMNPSTDDILSAIDKVNAENIFVLPNNKNIILAAQQAAAITDKNIIVIPSKSVPQGICAMESYDTDLEPDALTEEMTESLKRVITTQITTAVRDSDMGGLGIEKDDFIAIYEGELMGGGKDENTLIEKLIVKIKEAERDMITVFYGEDIDDKRAAEVAATLEAAFGEDNVSMIPGGQSVYRYIIAAE